MLAAQEKEVEYLRKRLEYLRFYNVDIENHLTDDIHKFINAHKDKRICNKYVWNIETVLRSTLRYTSLIAICTFLEEAVKFLCERSVADYEKKLKAYGHDRRTWLAKHRQILADNTSVDLAAVKVDLDTMEEFVKVRNCIVHGWGKVNKTIDRIIEIDEKRGADCRFGKWKDGFLVLTDQAVPTASFSSENIVKQLLQDLVGSSAHRVH